MQFGARSQWRTVDYNGFNGRLAGLDARGHRARRGGDPLSPCFSSYQEQVRLAEGVPVFVPLLEEEGWRLDMDGMARAITQRTKAIVVCNLANPTGRVA